MSTTPAGVAAAAAAAAPDAEAINARIAYTMWSVFSYAGAAPASDEERRAQADAALAAVADPGLTIRGWYDVSGLRAEADLMVW